MHDPRLTRRRRSGTLWWRVTGAAALGAVSVILGGCGGAPVAETTAPPATEPGTTSTTAATTTTTAPTTSTASTLPPLPEPSPALSSPGDNRVLVLGDSVILGAAIDVPKDLVGWNVTFDAKESRFINNVVGVIRQHKADADGLRALDRAKVEQAYADAGKVPPPAPKPLTLPEAIGRVVVVHLCTNYAAGGGFAGYIDAVMSELQGVERVVWVTCGEWSPGQTEANEAIRAAAAAEPRIVVADWARYAAGPGFTYEDGIHLTETGRVQLAELVARAVGPAPQPLPAPAPTTLPPPTSTTAPPEPPPEETPAA
jgi:hypothetical protein